MNELTSTEEISEKSLNFTKKRKPENSGEDISDDSGSEDSCESMPLVSCYYVIHRSEFRENEVVRCYTEAQDMAVYLTFYNANNYVSQPWLRNIYGISDFLPNYTKCYIVHTEYLMD